MAKKKPAKKAAERQRTKDGRKAYNRLAPKDRAKLEAAALASLQRGYRRGEIKQALRSQYRVSRATIERAITKAYESISSAAGVSRAEQAATLSEMLRQIAIRSERDVDRLRAIEQISKLWGLTGFLGDQAARRELEAEAAKDVDNDDVDSLRIEVLRELRGRREQVELAEDFEATRGDATARPDDSP